MFTPDQIVTVTGSGSAGIHHTLIRGDRVRIVKRVPESFAPYYEVETVLLCQTCAVGPHPFKARISEQDLLAEVPL